MPQKIIISKEPITEKEIQILYEIAKKTPDISPEHISFSNNIKLVQEEISKNPNVTEDWSITIEDGVSLVNYLLLKDNLFKIKNFGKGVDDFYDYMKWASPSLLLAMDNYCDKFQNNNLRCGHCYMSQGSENNMDSDSLLSLEPDFFKIFSKVVISVKGEPFLYKSRDRNLADIVEALADKGVSNFFLQSGIMTDNSLYEDVTIKLGKLKKNKNINIKSRITYHHFVKNHKLFRKGFARALYFHLLFSDKIDIKVLFDNLTQETSKEATLQSFYLFMHAFNSNPNFNFKNINDKNYYRFSSEDNSVEVISSISNRLFNYGEYSKRLRKNNLVEKYKPGFVPIMCKSSFIPDNVLLKQNGDTSFCDQCHYDVFKPEYNLFNGSLKGFLQYVEERAIVQKKEIEVILPQLLAGKTKFAPCFYI